MTVITVPGWEDWIDPRTLTPRERAALARFYAGEMLGQMSLDGGCDELAAVLGIQIESNSLQMIESWILHEMRQPREVNLVQLTFEFRELYRTWSYRESCGLQGEIDGNGNFIDADEPD